jgi:hypothetical protein
MSETEFPLAIKTFFNTEDGFGKNEKEFIDMVYGLSGLFVSDLKHLDQADIRSFFDYTKLLKMEPQLLSFIGPKQNSQIDIGEDNGDCEIKSGLEKGDYIAYPDKSIEEGMTATTNEADVSVPPNDLGTNDNSDADTEGGDEDIAFDGSDEDGMAIDEDMLASMTDEEIEEYFNKLYGEEENAENADGENADAADADAAFAE